MATELERILILAKTYPSPSAKYTETSCVAGINKLGQLRRLYPVPFRMISGDQQFKKWQWISVRVQKSPNDHRQESHRIFVDTIQIEEQVSSAKEWADRRLWIEKLPTFDNFLEMDNFRESDGISLALLRPKRLDRLEIIKATSQEWTAEEMTKLLQEQAQGTLFEQEDERRDLKLLKKLPYDFYYYYVCDSPNGEVTYKNKIVDWEVGMLYWNCARKYGDGWEKSFRNKLEEDFSKKDLMFLMGNIHRFQHQWLIISLIYPPKPALTNDLQAQLF